MVNYFVVFKVKKQISYHTHCPLPKEDEIIKEVNFDPLRSTLTLDSNDNIIINTIPAIKNDEKRTLQYVLAYLIKNKIFSYAIAVDSGELPSEQFYKFYNRIEQSLNFKIDETYSELFSTNK